MTSVGQETCDTRLYLALDAPFAVPEGLNLQYVDRFPVSELQVHYPELIGNSIVDPDIIDDGETLATIPDRSLDFIIASHFLEHCENPLRTLRNHFCTLKPGGRLLLAIPNSAYPESWDFGRKANDLSVSHGRRCEGPGDEQA